MVDLRAQWRRARAAALAAVERVGEAGWYVLGPEVEAFEASLATAAGVRFAVGTGNGMDAIEIALRAAGIGPGDRVLTTPLSAFATTLAVLRAGAQPVFVDVDASGLLDLELARAACADDPGIRAILPVHLFGHALDLEALAALGDASGAVVVEDCAQALAARSRGRPVGTVGRLSAVSFYPTKNLGALGDGGAVLTDREDDAAATRVLRDYGQAGKYEHVVTGLNSRLDELQAAILRDALLPHLAADTARRRAVADAYRAALATDAVAIPPVPAGSESVWHLFPVLVARASDREALRAHLALRGVETAIHYPRAIPDQPAATGARAASGLGRARDFAARELSLPLHPFLTDSDVAQVVDAVNAFRGARAAR
jgi:dTDP-4-amino-4,6-dideoxygalactose transaminase